jgi:hypothetical protein
MVMCLSLFPNESGSQTGKERAAGSHQMSRVKRLRNMQKALMLMLEAPRYKVAVANEMRNLKLLVKSGNSDVCIRALVSCFDVREEVELLVEILSQ